MTKNQSGIICMILATLCFALMGLFVKLLSPAIPASESLFVRSVVGLVFLIPYCLYNSISLTGSNYKVLFSRGFSGSISATCIFYAIAHAPLAESITLFRAAALYIPFLAWWLLKEKLKAIQVVYAFLGMLGTFLIFKPGFETISTGIFIAWIGSIFHAFSWVSVRSLANKENPLTIIIYFLGISAMLSFIIFGNTFIFPNNKELLYLFLLSILGTLGQIFLTLAYKNASAAVVTPIGYSEIVFMTILGWMAFNHIPDIYSFIGMFIIFVNSILISKTK